MADDIPGVRPQSGLLIAQASLAPAGGATQVDTIRWQSLGQNLVVGIHGYTSTSQGWTQVDGQVQEWMITLDPDAQANAVTFQDPQMLYHEHREIQVSSAVGVFKSNRSVQFYHEVPVFTVRNANLVVTNTITQKRVTVVLLYRIYEATDSAFLRIASVTLARGI